MKLAICLPAHFLHSTYQSIIELKYPQNFADFSSIPLIEWERKTVMPFIAFFVEEIFIYSVFLDIRYMDIVTGF